MNINHIIFKNINERFHFKQDSFSVIQFIISKEDDIYCSLCLELNIASEGETETEAIENLKEGIKDYIELAVKNKLEILRPVPLEDNPLFYDRDSIVNKIKIAVNLDLEYLDNQLYAKASGYKAENFN